MEKKEPLATAEVEEDTVSTSTDVDTPISCLWCNRKSCGRFWRSWNSYWQLLVLAVAVGIYLLVGGAIFNAVERPNELRRIQESAENQRNAIAEFTELLLNSTNLTQEEAENVTTRFLELGVVAAEAVENLRFEANPIWDYSSAVFFASTVVTTIGYGTIAPSTAAGQILFIFYAIIGIPLALFFLSLIGTVIQAWTNRLLRPVEKRWGATASRAIGSALLFLTVLIFFILLPAVIYYTIEDWNYRQSVYYTVVTLTTVGFGDFVPAQDFEGSVGLVGLYKIINSFWLWIGLALVAALISEIQETLKDTGVWCRAHPCCGLKERLEKGEEMKVMAQDSPEDTPSPVETSPKPVEA